MTNKNLDSEIIKRKLLLSRDNAFKEGNLQEARRLTELRNKLSDWIDSGQVLEQLPPELSAFADTLFLEETTDSPISEGALSGIGYRVSGDGGVSDTQHPTPDTPPEVRPAEKLTETSYIKDQVKVNPNIDAAQPEIKLELAPEVKLTYIIGASEGASSRAGSSIGYLVSEDGGVSDTQHPTSDTPPEVQPAEKLTETSYINEPTPQIDEEQSEIKVVSNVKAVSLVKVKKVETTASRNEKISDTDEIPAPPKSRNEPLESPIQAKLDDPLSAGLQLQALLLLAQAQQALITGETQTCLVLLEQTATMLNGQPDHQWIGQPKEPAQGLDRQLVAPPNVIKLPSVTNTTNQPTDGTALVLKIRTAISTRQPLSRLAKLTKEAKLLLETTSNQELKQAVEEAEERRRGLLEKTNRVTSLKDFETLLELLEELIKQGEPYFYDEYGEWDILGVRDYYKAGHIIQKAQKKPVMERLKDYYRARDIYPSHPDLAVVLPPTEVLAADILMTKGKDFFRQQDYNQALESFEQVRQLGKYLEHIESWIEQARSNLQPNSIREAVEL